MAIKDKDGTVYKLRGPNPLLKDMSDWDKARMKLINLGRATEIVMDDTTEKPEVVDIGERLKLKTNEETRFVRAKEFIEEIKNENVVSLPPEKPIKISQPVVLNADENVQRIIKERGIEYFCAPAIGFKDHMDPLYGSVYRTTQFGDKYVFDAVLIDFSDLQLQFWCIRPITKGSIVYKKDKEGGERWWAVAEVEPKTGGFLVKCTISDLNPDFS